MGRAFEYRKAAKMKRWDKMSKIFPKLSKAITVAAKDGGGDPDMNPKLRAAIQNAKAENMPKDNVDTAIKKALGKDASLMQEVSYEGKGPYGVLIFVETATDNGTRTVANMRVAFAKNGGQILTNGSLDFMFTRKAVFEFEKTDDMDLEELELSLIDAGLEEIEEHDGEIIVTGEYTSFGELNTAFDELGIEIKKSNLKRIANTPVSLNDEQMEELDNLIDKIEDDEDVLAVYTNIE